MVVFYEIICLLLFFFVIKSGLAELVYDVPVEPDDEVVTVVTTFQPLLLSSMSRSKDEGLGIADRVVIIFFLFIVDHSQ